KRAGVLVIGHLLGHEIEVEEEPLLGVPQILRDQFRAFFGALAPSFRIVGVPEPAADLPQIFFRFVEQGVETHRSIMMRRRSERSETKADVKSGLPHRAVAFIVVPAYLEFSG